MFLPDNDTVFVVFADVAEDAVTAWLVIFAVASNFACSDVFCVCAKVFALRFVVGIVNVDFAVVTDGFIVVDSSFVVVFSGSDTLLVVDCIVFCAVLFNFVWISVVNDAVAAVS